MARFVTFGEVMARLAPPGFLRLAQTLPGSLDVTFAGAEANVAASLAMLGAEVEFVTALPAKVQFSGGRSSTRLCTADRAAGDRVSKT